jgi:hypothetical protein
MEIQDPGAPKELKDLLDVTETQVYLDLPDPPDLLDPVVMAVTCTPLDKKDPVPQ